MRFLIIILIFFNLSNFTAQNLVPNPSFELFTNCFTPNDLQYFTCQDWDSIGVGSPDHFTYCNSHPALTIPNNFAGYQVAKHGENYIGTVCLMPNSSIENVREYVYTTLKVPLIKDSVYYFSCWIAMNDYAKYAIKNFGAFISHQIPIPNNGRLLDTLPQVRNNVYIDDSTSWYKVEGEFIATGNEQYLTLGNFDHDSLVNWYRLYPFNNPNSGDNFVYFIIDSVWLSLKSQVPVIPEDTTTNPEPIDSTIVENPIDCIQIYPNPSAGIFQIDCSEDITHIKVYDDVGRLVLQQFSNFQLLDLSFYRNATYLVVINTDATVYRRKLVLLR